MLQVASHRPAPSARWQTGEASSDTPVPRLLLWHWGRIGAGAKFTFELAKALSRMQDAPIRVSASKASELDALCSGTPEVALDAVETFRGQRGTLGGTVRAAIGLAKIAKLGRDFSQILATRRPDVVLCTFQSIWDLAALSALRRSDARYILVLHDAWFRVGDGYPLRSFALARQVADTDGLIVLSDHVGQVAQQTFGYPADRIWTIPHGQFVFGDRIVVPRRLPRDRRPRFLFLGRIVAYKGLGLLLDACRILRDRDVAFDLEVSGDGDLSSHRDGLADLPHLRVTNRWLDEAEIASALSRADVVVLPYVEATQSGIAAAAFTAALPVVATPVGGLVEQVRDGETGLIAASVSPSALADVMERLVEDHALYERCSAEALRHAQVDLAWSAVAQKIAAIAQLVAQAPKRRADA